MSRERSSTFFTHLVITNEYFYRRIRDSIKNESLIKIFHKNSPIQLPPSPPFQRLSIKRDARRIKIKTFLGEYQKVIASLSLTIGRVTPVRTLLCVLHSSTRAYVYMHILARVERCRARRRAIDIPDWTKIPWPGPVTQNWKHFTRRRGRRHVSRIRSNKLRGIGNRRPRTKPHTRPALPPPPAPSSPPSIFFPCPRVRQPGPGRDFAPISLSNSPILWK